MEIYKNSFFDLIFLKIEIANIANSNEFDILTILLIFIKIMQIYIIYNA